MKLIHVCIIAGLLSTALSHLISAETYPWQETHAKVLPNGDLEWAPKAFELKTGDSVRYIDYENGDDSKDGSSKANAWKHHPWDKQAGGKAKACSGIHTYIFKRGVIYRGALVASESGTAGNPLRLTSDPSWGDGAAIISGSVPVTQWQKGSAHSDIPDGDKVYAAKLKFSPRMLHVRNSDGTLTKVPIARTPNWTVTDDQDVLSNWFEWEQPEWWKREKHQIQVGKKKMILATDRKNLSEDADYYKGALIWSEWSVVMSTPYPTKVEAVPEQGQLAFEGRWWGTSVSLRTGCRYMLEDSPKYLDSAGEYWFDRQDNNTGAGTLYLRLPNDVDPNTVQIEAAKHYSLLQDTASAQAPNRLDILGANKNDPKTVSDKGVQHIEISGLTFQGNNTWWNLEYPSWMHKEVNSAAIRFRGSCDHVVIANCAFEHVTTGVQIEPINVNAHNGTITVQDNTFHYTDSSASQLGKGAGTVQKINFLRNKGYMIGLRPYRQSDGHAFRVNFPTEMHVAGNFLKRCYGAGIFVFGGKGSGAAGDVPLSRHLVHHNKVEDSLLCANDWGGIETWQGGPYYVYNNISANPGGLWHARVNNPEFGARLGFAYYLDGSFKNYLFNNIAWGRNNDKNNTEANAYAFYEAVPTVHNHYINNTIYRFASGSSWSPRGGHKHIVGNLWSDITNSVFHHGKLKEDKSKSPTEYPHELMAYGPDVFHKIRGTFGQFENLPPVEDQKMTDFNKMSEAVKRNKTINQNLGTTAEYDVMRDPANWDMRLTKDSAAIDKGAVHFVPWGLYGMVAEWNFYTQGKDQTKIIDEHWYLTDYMTNRSTYYAAPQFHLSAVNTTAESFVDGPLENWAKGSLKLNGDNQYAVLKHSDIDKPFTYKKRVARRKTEDATIGGPQIKSPGIQDSNFLIEVYLKTKPGQSSGILVRKMADVGFDLSLNEQGGVALSVKGKESASISSKGTINDGKWHHVIVEADRKAKTFTIYIDGKPDSQSPGVGFVSLWNEADLFVGGSENGDCLNGELEFMRICLGTLKDARTSIEELYTWQFDGPHLRDFAGNKPKGKRDAGALEYVD